MGGPLLGERLVAGSSGAWMPPPSATFGDFALLRRLAAAADGGDLCLASRSGPFGFQKLLLLERAPSGLPRAEAMFARAKLLAQLNHTNIVKIHEVGEAEGYAFVALEHVRGKSLAMVLERIQEEKRLLPVAHAVDIAISIADALGHAHRTKDIRGAPLSLVHGDLRSSSTLISYQGYPKLADFIDPAENEAPALDPRTDLLGLGFLLYRMCCLEEPSVDRADPSIRKALVLPSAFRADAAPLDAILLRGLAPRPEDRFQTAQEMRDALRALVRAGRIPPADEHLGALLQALFAEDIVREEQTLADAVGARSEPTAPVVDVSEYFREARTEAATADSPLDPEAAAPRCPVCKGTFEKSVKRCPVHGRKLVAAGEEEGDLGAESEDGCETIPDLGDRFTGRVLEQRFLVEKRIGEGGMGVVYRGHDRTTGDPVAIKLLKAHGADKSKLETRFRREAKLLAKLDHPNTVKFVDWGFAPDGTIFIATELLTGLPLDKLIEGNPSGLGVSRTLSILDRIAASLEDAHALGVVHRDLKPANVFVDGVKVKLFDFGIARIDLAGELSNTFAEKTAAGFALFTPMYCAPEQAVGDVIDHRADIYSLGAVAYHCLAGKTPFSGSTTALVEAHLSKPPPPISERSPNAETSAEVELLIRKMMEKRPEDRIQTVREIRGRIGRLSGGDSPTQLDLSTRADRRLLAKPREDTPLPAMRSRRPLIATVVAVLLLALAGITSLYLLDPVPTVATGSQGEIPVDRWLLLLEQAAADAGIEAADAAKMVERDAIPPAMTERVARALSMEHAEVVRRLHANNGALAQGIRAARARADNEAEWVCGFCGTSEAGCPYRPSHTTTTSHFHQQGHLPVYGLVQSDDLRF